MFRRRRQVTEETAVQPPAGRYVQEEVVTPPPRRPLIWPWLVLLLALVITGIVGAYLLTRDNGSSTAKVPNVVGLTTATATQRLAAKGYVVTTVGRASSAERPGTVLSQNPPPGTKLDRGGRVTIVVARGPSTVDVPSVVGLPVDQAFVRLQSAGLKGQTVKVGSPKPVNSVIRQDPSGGSQAKKGSTVTLTVSKGEVLAAVTVPNVTGLTEASATATLSRLGFRVSVSRIPATKPKGIVFSQTPQAGTKAAKRSIVGINVSTGTSSAGGVTVPKVVGLSQAVAVTRMEDLGLRVDSFPVASQKPQGTVVSENPAGGTQVPARSHVRITVSLGPGPRRQVEVPDVLGELEADARHALIQAGFTVKTLDQATTDSTENGVVLKEKPDGGQQAAAGSQIVIYVGRLPTAAD